LVKTLPPSFCFDRSESVKFIGGTEQQQTPEKSHCSLCLPGPENTNRSLLFR